MYAHMYMYMYIHVCMQSLEEKEKGNAAYKTRDFETSLQHYDKALELDPTNITFLTNKAGGYLVIAGTSSLAC